MPAMMIGGGALLGVAGSVFGGVFGNSASKKQAAAIRESANVARQTALDMNNKAWSEYGNATNRYSQPFTDRGNIAGNELLDLLRGKTDVSKLLQESDLFKFESNLGQRDINRQLKARGLYGSGAGLEALSRFETELTAKEGQRHWDRLIGGYTELSRQGLQAGNQAVSGAAGLAGATSGLGGQLAQVQGQMGLAAAQSEGDATRAWGNMAQGIGGAVGQGMGNFMQYQMLQPLLGGGSSKGPDLQKLFGWGNSAPGAPMNVQATMSSPLSLSNPEYSDMAMRA